MLSKYYKSVLAFLVPLAALVPVVATNDQVQAALPGVSAWLLAVGLPVVTGVVAFLTRNQPTVEQIDTAIDKSEITVRDLEALIKNRRAGSV